MSTFNEEVEELEEVEEQEVQDEETNEQEEEEREEKRSESPEAKLARLKRQAAQLEKKLGVAPVKVAPKQEEAPSRDISTKDLYALMGANVPEDDIADVQEYAQMKGISIKEALATNVVKTILSTKAEERSVAQAANVGSSKRNSGGVSDDVLLANAAKGKLPESDADIMRLIKAQKGLK